MTTPPQICVSSFSLREQLGPIVFRFRDAAGAEQTFELDNPRLLEISEFPRRARDELGVDSVESVGFHFAGLDDPEVERFEKALADAGVRLLNMCFDMGDLLDPDGDRRASDIGEIKRWIARFAAMGSTFVRINPGSPASPHGGTTPPGHLLAGLAELGEFARAEGSRLLVENHNGRGSDPAWLNALLDQVGEHCGLLLDLGNFQPLLAGLGALRDHPDPSSVDLPAVLAQVDMAPVYAAIESLAPRAELVSVKTNYVTDDGSIGAVDLDRAMAILVDHGFAGALSVEYEGFGGDPWAKTRKVVDASRHALVAAQAR